MANPLTMNLRASIARCKLSGATLVVAVSGGPDSLALLLGLAELRAVLNLRLHVAHFNHHLRADSDDDATFVQNLARSLDLNVTIGDGNVRDMARRRRLGIEEAARHERYRFLAGVSNTERADAVVVGHTLDDQSETRLMHVVRGSGLAGLSGMSEDSILTLMDGCRLRIVRPLLTTTRSETEAFCSEQQVTPRLDSSNLDRAFFRNRLRHEVLPRLRESNPRLDESLARLARAASDAEQFVASELDRRMSQLVSESEFEWTIDRGAWHDLPAALKRALLRRAAFRLASTEALASGSPVDAENVETALQAMDSWSSGKTLSWPDGLEIHLWHDRAFVRRSRGFVPPLEESELSLDNGFAVVESVTSTIFPEYQATARPTMVGAVVHARRREACCVDRSDDRLHCDLDGAKLAEARLLVVRARRPGDWLMPTGMSGRKKVQDLLVDARVPREVRDHVPVITARDDVVWIAGLRPDRRYLADSRSRDVYCLSVRAFSPEIGSVQQPKNGRELCAT